VTDRQTDRHRSTALRSVARQKLHFKAAAARKNPSATSFKSCDSCKYASDADRRLLRSLRSRGLHILSSFKCYIMYNNVAAWTNITKQTQITLQTCSSLQPVTDNWLRDGLRLGISTPTRQHPPVYVVGHGRFPERADRRIWSPNGSAADWTLRKPQSYLSSVRFPSCHTSLF